MITEEEFKEWKDQPTTEAVFKIWQEEVDRRVEELNKRDLWPILNDEKRRLAVAHAAGIVDGMESLINTEIEDE